MRSVRTTALSALATATLLAGLTLAPAAAHSGDEAADVVTDWNVHALGAIAASGGLPVVPTDTTEATTTATDTTSTTENTTTTAPPPSEPSGGVQQAQGGTP